MPELDKTYTPADVESRWYQQWLDDKAFVADPSRVSEKRPAYSIVIPPPNVTGILTLGHVLNNTIQDILCRRARMLGKEVLWLPGTDHAGIATQNVVEKNLKKQGVIKHRDDLGREGLVEKIWEWKEKHGGIIIQQLKKLGASCDWSRERFTMDPEYSRCVQRVFVDLYKKGMIYRGKRMVNWCPSSLTALSDEEVTMKPQNGTMYYFQVEVVDDDASQAARPRAVDITQQQEDTARHEHTQRDGRTGCDTYITGPRFDERRGPALSAANRRRVGQAQSFLDFLVGGGASEQAGEDGGPRLRTVSEAARSAGIPLIRLPDIGVVQDRTGRWSPAGADLQRLPAGSEAQPFLDHQGGVVYKIFATNEDGFIGKKLLATRSDDGQWTVTNAPTSFEASVEKLAFLHEIGGLPTEIVGMTPQGYWLVKQPQATLIDREELGAARAEAVALVGGVQVAEPGLESIRIVWHQNRAWMIGDLHAQNIMRDSEGKARIMDALIAPVPDRMIAELESMRRAVVEAKAKAGELATASHAQLEMSLFPSAERKTFLTIATTRPEVIPGDQAIAVNPKDPRYSHLIGKKARRPLPLEDQALLPIVGDEHVDFTFGTGVLKVTPAHDKADFEIAQRHGLPAVDVMHPNGVLNELAGKDLAGMERFAARKRASELLAEIGSLVKEEPYQNNVGYSERADVPIESRLSEQWFLKYPSVQPSQDVVAKGEMRFFPDRWAKVYDHWMGGLQDWCISRQLWWGHRVPVWYSKGLREQDRAVQIVECEHSPIEGKNIKELRESAWAWAESHGIVGHEFHNDDTNSDIEVVKASLRHAFDNYGVVNVLLIPLLPKLLQSALLVATVPHEPYSPEIKAVHRYFSGCRMGGKLYRVKFTVKERRDGHRLYDHQSAEIVEEEKVELGGNKSPAGHPGEGKLPTRPAPSSVASLAHLTAEVNSTDDFIRCQVDCPGDTWTQDPDVLDTWFSSWLWPFATMGWPNETADLKAFYPTTDLVTGPDIIFFWVARMIMAGYEYMGELPFKNVYFTGIIRDKQGRKMSKSLGNSPDPLELIASYSADALRFGIMRSAPLGQDIAFDEKNVELGRNFCTKLWNACRFRQMQGGEVENEINPALLSSDDKWILLRLNTAITEVTTALEEYRFSDATSTLYRFFWSEYCDWYVEASKAVLQGTDDKRKANTVAVIDFILGHTLRLFHPFLPFITEELWHGMGFNADMPENQGGKSIMFAPWPKPMDADELAHFGILPEDEKTANDKYETVNLGRGLKSSFNLNKKVRFVLKTNQVLPEHEIEVLRILLNAEPLDIVDASFSPGKGTPAVLTPLGELFLPLDGVIDVEAERARVAKEIAKVDAELGKVKAKLADENFTSKVPQKVLDEHKQRESDWSAQFEKLKVMLEALG